MGEQETIRFGDFVASRATALYRHALLLTRSKEKAEQLLVETLIRTGLAWREAVASDPEHYARAAMADLSRGASTVDDPAEIAALADAPTTRAPRGLADRVERGIAIRKRRRRGRGLAVAGGLSLTLLLAFGASALRGEAPSPGSLPAQATQTSTRQRWTSEPAIPIAQAAPAALDRIIDRENAVKLPVRQPDGLAFRAEALGSNGIVLGGTGFDYGAYRATDGLVWAIRPDSGRRVALTAPPPRQPWAVTAGSAVAAWAEDVGERFELFCADPMSRLPSARQVSRTGVATAEQPIHADGDVVVWVDDADAVQWVRGCAGEPRALDVPNVLGLSYPEVFYSERGRIVAFNLESGQHAIAGQLTGVAESARPAFAASRSYFAWSIGDMMFVLDRRGGQVRSMVLPGLPAQVDAAGARLSIGNRLVAYAHRIGESDVEYGFVYDVVTRTHLRLPTAAFACRDTLLWREEASYLVATARSG